MKEVLSREKSHSHKITVKYPLSDRIEKGKVVQLNTNFDPQMKQDKCKIRANSKIIRCCPNYKSWRL